MKSSHKPTKVLIAGASGTGKTTFALGYIAADLMHGSVLIYDWQSEIAGRLNVPPVPLDAGAIFARLADHRLCCVDPLLTETRGEDGLAELCPIARAWAAEQHQPSLLVVDELHRLGTTAANGLPEQFVDALEFGRRDGLDVLVISQAPNLLNNRIRNQTTEAVLFRLIDERAAKWCEPFGIDRETLLNLDRGQFCYLNVDTGANWRGRIF